MAASNGAISVKMDNLGGGGGVEKKPKIPPWNQNNME